MVACCEKCSFCGKNIKNEYIEKHKIACASARDPLCGPTFEEISKATKKRKKD